VGTIAVNLSAFGWDRLAPFRKSFRKVFAQWAVGILVGAALHGALGSAKVALRAGVDRELDLFSKVPCREPCTSQIVFMRFTAFISSVTKAI
jgi:hypothetical protein